MGFDCFLGFRRVIFLVVMVEEVGLMLLMEERLAHFGGRISVNFQCVVKGAVAFVFEGLELASVG